MPSFLRTVKYMNAETQKKISHLYQVFDKLNSFKEKNVNEEILDRLKYEAELIPIIVDSIKLDLKREK